MKKVAKEVETFLAKNSAFRACLEDKLQLAKKVDQDTGATYTHAINQLMTESHDMDTMVSDMFKREWSIYKSLNE